MHSPTMFVPKKNSNPKYGETHVTSFDPDTIVTLEMGVTESQEIQTYDPNAEKEREVIGGKSNAKQDYVVYQYYGQHVQPKDTWVAYNYGQDDGFDRAPSRNSFVKLVLTIVFFMLLCTVGFNIFVHVYSPVTKLFEKYGIFFLLVGIITQLALSYAITCSKCASVAPCSYFCLGLTVIGQSLVTSYFTVRVAKILIVYALIATTLTVFVCVLLACSSFDFTKFWIYIIVASCVFSILSLCIILGMYFANVYFKPLHLTLLFIGTLLNVVILISELQMIIGGKSIELGEDEYAVAAFMVYTSVIDIFIRMLFITELLNS